MNRIVLFLNILLLNLPWVSADEMSPQLLDLSERWAQIKYSMPENQRVEALEKLSSDAEKLVLELPDEAEPLVWQAVVLSTLAGEQGGVAGLSLVKRAKRLLEQAEGIDPETLDGSIYTLLGSLYYQVPGWPVGFGNGDKAREYLLKALAVSPNGIDSNYYYGDFLLHNKEYPAAVEAFEKALQAPPRQQRPMADAGRRKEAETALAKAKKQME